MRQMGYCQRGQAPPLSASSLAISIQRLSTHPPHPSSLVSTPRANPQHHLSNQVCHISLRHSTSLPIQLCLSPRHCHSPRPSRAMSLLLDLHTSLNPPIPPIPTPKLSPHTPRQTWGYQLHLSRSQGIQVLGLHRRVSPHTPPTAHPIPALCLPTPARPPHTLGSPKLIS